MKVGSATKIRCSRHVGAAELKKTSQKCYEWLREETAKRWSPEIEAVWPSMEPHAHWGGPHVILLSTDVRQPCEFQSPLSVSMSDPDPCPAHYHPNVPGKLLRKH